MRNHSSNKLPSHLPSTHLSSGEPNRTENFTLCLYRFHPTTSNYHFESYLGSRGEGEDGGDGGGGGVAVGGAAAVGGHLFGLRGRPRLRLHHPLLGEVGGVVKVGPLQTRRQRRRLKEWRRGENEEVKAKATDEGFSSFRWN